MFGNRWGFVSHLGLISTAARLSAAVALSGEIQPRILRYAQDDTLLSSELVLGHGGVDLPGPGEDSAGEVLYLEALFVEQFGGGLAAAAGFALDDDWLRFVELR